MLSKALVFLRSEGFEVTAKTTLAQIQDQHFDSVDSINLTLTLWPQAKEWVDEWMTCKPKTTLGNYILMLSRKSQARDCDLCGH